MKQVLIHVPHASLYIPEEYRQTALIPQEELEEENRFMCDTGVLQLIPEAFAENALIFVYLAMDMITFAVSIVLLWRMDVEKYAAEDQQKIKEYKERTASSDDH